MFAFTCVVITLVSMTLLTGLSPVSDVCMGGRCRKTWGATLSNLHVQAGPKNCTFSITMSV